MKFHCSQLFLIIKNHDLLPIFFIVPSYSVKRMFLTRSRINFIAKNENNLLPQTLRSIYSFHLKIKTRSPTNSFKRKNL